MKYRNAGSGIYLLLLSSSDAIPLREKSRLPTCYLSFLFLIAICPIKWFPLSFGMPKWETISGCLSVLLITRVREEEKDEISVQAFRVREVSVPLISGACSQTERQIFWTGKILEVTYPDSSSNRWLYISCMPHGNSFDMVPGNKYQRKCFIQ